MDFSKLKPGDWLIGGGTLLFLIAMFLPWFEADFEGFGGGEAANGWDYAFFGIVPLLLLIAVTVFLVVPKLTSGMNLPETVGPLPKTQAALIAAAAAAVIVLLRLLLGFEEDIPEGFGVEVNRGIGLFLAAVAALAATAGAFLKFSGKEPEAAGPGTGPATPF